MKKRTIWTRFRTLLRANATAALDKAEDPKLMLDQLVADYTEDVRKAESAVAESIGAARMMEHNLAQHRADATEWGEKAITASDRATSRPQEAEKFDNLARIALKGQLDSEAAAAQLAPQVEQQLRSVEQMKHGIAVMRQKLVEVKAQRDQLVARSRVAATQAKMLDAVQQVNAGDLTSDLARFRERVLTQEANALGKAELAAANVEVQFSELEANVDLEERFTALKASATRREVEGR